VVASCDQPSPDYCCPHSVLDCNDPKAILFDAATANRGVPVPDHSITHGWLNHFLAKLDATHRPFTSNVELARSVCNASDWNGGHRGKWGCSNIAMTNTSVQRVRTLWERAPPYHGPNGEKVPVDDDKIG